MYRNEEEYKRYLLHQREKHPKKVIKSQTGSGKTQNVGYLMKNLAFGNCIIAVPTIPLKKEVYHRLVDMGIKDIKMTPELEDLKDEGIYNEQKYFIDIGAFHKRKEYLQEQVKLLRQKKNRQD